MPLQRADLRLDLGENLAAQLTIVEKRDVLRPGHASHDAQAVLGRGVEHIEGWQCIRADHVDPRTRHAREIAAHLIRSRKLVTVVPSCKGAVGHPANTEGVGSDCKELTGARGALGRPGFEILHSSCC